MPLYIASRLFIFYQILLLQQLLFAYSTIFYFCIKHFCCSTCTAYCIPFYSFWIFFQALFTELNWKHFTILSCMNFEFWNLYGTSFTQLHCSSPCFMNITYSVYTVYTILYTEPSIQTAHFLPKISLIRTLHLLAYSPTMAPPPPHTELTAFCTVHIAPPLFSSPKLWKINNFPSKFELTSAGEIRDVDCQCWLCLLSQNSLLLLSLSCPKWGWP